MKQYLDLLTTIKEKGSYKEPARENMPGTTSLFGYQFRHNLKDGFPILTTKKIYWKGVVMELLWFLRGDTNIKFLDDHGVKKMWHEDAYAYYCKMHYGYGSNIQLLSFNEFINHIEVDDIENKITSHATFKLGDCGHQYGALWRAFNDTQDQILAVIKSLISSPYGRRHIVTAWNPERLNDMALNACFTGESLVYTKNGYKQIKDIENGDLVLTKEGNFKKVYDKFCNPFKGTLIGIKVSGCTEIIKCTPNHKFWTMNGEWKQAALLTDNDYVCLPVNKESELKNITHLVKNNQFTTKEHEINLNNEDLWWVMGYFLGDGWRNFKSNTINFSVCNTEVNDVVPLIKRIFPSLNTWRSVDKDKGKGCRTWSVSSKEYAPLFEEFGQYCHGKFIPGWVHDAPQNLIIKFLEGYKQSDGTKTKELYELTTISKSIAYGVQILFSKIGLYSSVIKSNRAGYTKIQGRDVRQNKELFCVRQIKGVNFTSKKDDFLHYKKIEKIHHYPDIETNVYNLSVEDSHTYTVYNAIVSNCHALFQFNCRKLTLDERIAISGVFIEDQVRYTLEMEIEESLDEDKIPKYYLDCQMYQRSADVFLGVPLNTASYALLTHIIAKICNMIPGELIHTFGDVHIYSNHKEQALLQMSRDVKKLPTLKLSDRFNEVDIKSIISSSHSLTQFFEKIEFSDFELQGYDPHPSIKADLSTGIKK